MPRSIRQMGPSVIMDSFLLRKSIEHFLREDTGAGDITSEAIFFPEQTGEAVFIAKDSFIVAGMEMVAAQVFKIRNPEIETNSAAADGTTASDGDILLKIKGPVLDLLAAERVALNLVQRLCGIATFTAKFVRKVRKFPVRIVDTRKTTPGLRMLEKYAVRVGGGHNHRFNLADGVLIKDNHIAACGSISRAVNQIKERTPHTFRIEVEAETIKQVRECLDCKVDIIMLDNMDIPTIRKAAKIVNGKATLEVSGGVKLKDIKKIAEAGIDIVSIGALTHSAPACDISMRFSASI